MENPEHSSNLAVFSKYYFIWLKVKFASNIADNIIFDIVWIIYDILFLYIDCNGLIVPQELPSVLSLVYSNIPPIKKGTDSRVGFGFRLGEHADFQVLFELGPQKFTKPLGKWNKYFLCGKSHFNFLSISGKGADDDSDTSKRMVDQTDYNKKEKVRIKLN